MKGTTYEATGQDGRVVLPEDAQKIPDNTRVYVVVPEADDAHRVRMMTPRLVHRGEAADFMMLVELEGDDARL
jgi:hypothetical protein